MDAIKYKIVKNLHSPKYETHKKYAVIALEGGVVVKRIDDVFNSRKYAKQLVRTCNKIGDITPDSIEYIIEDFKLEIMYSL